MDKKSLYQTIVMRKSIRKYDTKPLDEKLLTNISSFIAELKPLYPDIQTELKIINPGEGGGIITSKNAYHAVIFSEEKEGYLENAGYMIQQLDLFLSANNIGSCWRGAPQLKGSVLKLSLLKYVIMLSFGYPAEPIHRERIEEFDRKSADKVWNVKGLDVLMEPVRLAPSGMNRQPWLFEGSEGKIDVFCSKGNILSNKFLANMDRLGIGIALCHLWLAAELNGKKMDVSHPETGENSSVKVPKGYYQVVSVQVK